MKYVLLTEIKTEASEAEWWMDQTDRTASLQIFETFEEAKTAMRKSVKQAAKSCKFFPFKGGRYQPIEKKRQYDGYAKLGEIVNNTIKTPDYVCEETDFDMESVDNYNRWYAFVGNKDFILADDCDTRLSMNIHDMSDAEKSYYFEYTEIDDDERVVNAISIRLLNEAQKRSPDKRKETPLYETITFGRYMQDKNGDELSPLSWRVLTKKDGLALLVTEKVIDHVQFASSKNNDWEKSDMLKWLNKDFADLAFNKQEKELIQNNVSGKKVFLLSLDEYEAYFSNPKDARAGYTDYARKRTSHDMATAIREPYAFWWLRTANEEGGWGEDGSVYIYHVTGAGEVNAFERAEYSDGVRPAIWINLKT